MATITEQDLLCCPACKQGNLKAEKNRYLCTNPSCGREYPVVDGIPILIVPERSVFAPEDFLAKHETTFRKPSGNPVYRFLKKLIPNIGKKRGKDDFRYDLMVRDIADSFPEPRVLIIGVGTVGPGVQLLLDHPGIKVIETDVSLSPHIHMICDAHDIPFRDATFSAVLVQNVLEHVADPFQCVSEIHRVLQPDGRVFASTPFMQSVHMGAYDFMRFTHLGHRRLFRRFEEIESGIAGGPGKVLFWATRDFFRAFTVRHRTRVLVDAIVSFLFIWLAYIDIWLSRSKRAYDSASGYYFYGKKSSLTLSDRDLIRFYRGAQNR